MEERGCRVYLKCISGEQVVNGAWPQQPSVPEVFLPQNSSTVAFPPYAFSLSVRTLGLVWMIIIMSEIIRKRETWGGGGVEV